MTDEARVWDALAHRYDAIVRIFDKSYPAIRERAEEDLRGRGEVLELAAGTGQFTPTLSRTAQHLVSTDISPEMVQQLDAAVREASLPNVDVRVMSSYAIEGGDGQFDAVFCANALHVMEEPARALAEVRRALKPGGLLIAPTFLHGVDAMRVGLSRALGLVSPFVAYTRFSLEELSGLVERSGFEILKAEQLPGLFPVGYVVARAS